MSSKGNKKAQAGGKKASDDAQQKNILQAVVLTDSYQTRFRPLTHERPRCLLPLANIPLIEYTLEWLSLAGVEDVFIFTSTHAEAIEAHIRASKWSQPSSTFKKCQIVMAPSSLSVGDAMRELDAKSMISADFLLVNGDFVSNLPLAPVLAAHRARRSADKNAIMTMVLKEAGAAHRSKARGETGVFFLDEAASRCVHYEELRPTGGSRLELPPDLARAHPQLRVRADLLDCQVDVCSPDVPALFTENFDYQRLRRDFVHGILTDYELYGKTIHTYVVDAAGPYAARVRSLQTYDGVSRDVVQRWAFPLCPDANLHADHAYTLERAHVYREDGVVLARGARVLRNSVLGHGTHVGERTSISDSVLGRHVRIGADCDIQGAYIWAGAQIGAGCTVQRAIVADGAVIGDGCTIQTGAVVSFGVRVPPHTTVDSQTRLSALARRTADAAAAATYPGDEYETTDSESEDEQAAAAHDRLRGLYHEPLLARSDQSISTLPDSDSEADSDDDDAAAGAGAPRPRSTSMTSTGSEAEDEGWHREAAHSLLVAMEGDHPVEVASLELNGMRMSQNASWHQVRRALAEALAKRTEQVAQGPAKSVARAAAEVLRRWLGLVRRCIHERDDQVDFLLLWQRECAHRAAGDALLVNALKVGYELDFLEEEGIRAWWADERSAAEEKLAKVKAAAGVFVKWLDEADEEDSDEEAESEEEEESEDDDE